MRPSRALGPTASAKDREGDCGTLHRRSRRPIDDSFRELVLAAATVHMCVCVHIHTYIYIYIYIYIFFLNTFSLTCLIIWFIYMHIEVERWPLW